MPRDMESHRRDAKIENARWLLDDVGLHPAQVARRLGMSEDALEKMMGRHRGDTDPGVEQAGSQSA